MVYDSKNEKNEFSDVNFASHASQERIEDISHAKEHAEQLAELSGIEATAASKAAWLISITVSLGGLLFGTYHFEHKSTIAAAVALGSTRQELITYRLRYWIHLLGPRHDR
jgi:SP family myo-inositol transporter-like MFS transporter 13